MDQQRAQQNPLPRKYNAVEEKNYIEFIKPVDTSIKDKLHAMAKNGFGVNNPNLITLELIDKKIAEWKEENKIFSREIKPEDCTDIALSFSGILQISNLDNLRKLEILRLDNNMIMKIENLDNLVNIKWLDLSFNFISKIEGLDNLENLTDLSLFANQIREVSGLDKNRKLNVLSVGKNCIEDAKQMALYLKKFTNLQALCVHFNGFCKDEDSVQKVIEDNDPKSTDTFPSSYNIILQNLKYLRYLDWKPLNNEVVKKAMQSASAAAKDDKDDIGEKEERKRREEAMLKKADLEECIDFSKKVDKAFTDDINDFNDLKVINGLQVAIASAEKNIDEQIEQFKEISLAIQADKEALIERKKKELEKNEERFIEKSKELIRQFKRKYKKFIKDLQEGKEDPHKSVEEVAKITGLESLRVELLEIEVYVKEKNKTKLNEFKNEVEEKNKKLSGEAEKLKVALEAIKTTLKDSTLRSANEAKAEFDKWTEQMNENGENKEDEYGQDRPIAQVQQGENTEEYKEYMEKLKALFTEKGGEAISDVEKIHETLDDRISKLRDSLESARATSFKTFFDNLNEKENYRNKKRVEDIKEIYEIYINKIKEALDQVENQ